MSDERKMLVHVNGNSWVFRGDEIDELFRRVRETEGPAEAWETTEQFGRELAQ